MDVILPEENKKSVFANTFRAQIAEDAITLQFGYAPDIEKIDETDENDDNVSIVGDISFSPEMLIPLIANLFAAGHSYQEEYQKNIGINVDETQVEVEQDAGDGIQK